MALIEKLTVGRREAVKVLTFSPDHSSCTLGNLVMEEENLKNCLWGWEQGETFASEGAIPGGAGQEVNQSGPKEQNKLPVSINLRLRNLSFPRN